MILSEHLAIWLAAEKYAVGKFDISDRHWIHRRSKKLSIDFIQNSSRGVLNVRE